MWPQKKNPLFSVILHSFEPAIRIQQLPDPSLSDDYETSRIENTYLNEFLQY